MTEDQDPNYANTKKAQEEARRHDKRLQARNQRFEAKQQQSNRRNAKIVAWIGSLGALATIVAALIGANSPKAANQTTNFFGNVSIGYQVIGEAITGGKLRTEASQQAPAPQGSPSTPSPQQNTEQKLPVLPQTTEVDVARIAGARCILSDSTGWAVSTDDATPLKDRSNNYYTVDLRLKNLSTNSLYVTHYNDIGSMSDTARNQFYLRSSIPKNQFGLGGVKVAPQSEIPVTLTSNGVPTPLGAKVNFDSLFAISATDERGQAQTPVKLSVSCHNLPVAATDAAAGANP